MKVKTLYNISKFDTEVPFCIRHIKVLYSVYFYTEVLFSQNIHYARRLDNHLCVYIQTFFRLSYSPSTNMKALWWQIFILVLIRVKSLVLSLKPRHFWLTDVINKPQIKIKHKINYTTGTSSHSN